MEENLDEMDGNDLENTISTMRDSGEFLDIDLRCEEGSFGIQKIVLVMHSEYYRDAFLTLEKLAEAKGKANGKACILLEDVELIDLVNIVTYMYEGTVNIGKADLPGFLSVATQLRIDDIENSKLTLEQYTRGGLEESMESECVPEAGSSSLRSPLTSPLLTLQRSKKRLMNPMKSPSSVRSILKPPQSSVTSERASFKSSSFEDSSGDIPTASSNSDDESPLRDYADAPRTCKCEATWLTNNAVMTC